MIDQLAQRRQRIVSNWKSNPQESSVAAVIEKKPEPMVAAGFSHLDVIESPSEDAQLATEIIKESPAVVAVDGVQSNPIECMDGGYPDEALPEVAPGTSDEVANEKVSLTQQVEDDANNDYETSTQTKCMDPILGAAQGSSTGAQGPVSSGYVSDVEQAEMTAGSMQDSLHKPVMGTSVREKMREETRLQKRDLDAHGGANFDGVELSSVNVALLARYRESRIRFGTDRIELGACLYLIKENKLWKGLASNWEEFLASENVNSHAARQYINVAKTFVFDLEVDDAVLRKLSVAGISALEKAAKIINEDNKEDIIGALTELAEKDAIQRIIEMTSEEAPPTDKPAMKVLRLLRDFHEMPPDLQFDFVNRLNAGKKKPR